MPLQGLFHSLVSRWTVAMSFDRIDGACRQEWQCYTHFLSRTQPHHLVLRLKPTVSETHGSCLEIICSIHTKIQTTRAFLSEIMSDVVHWWNDSFCKVFLRIASMFNPASIWSNNIGCITDQCNLLHGKKVFCAGNKTGTESMENVITFVQQPRHWNSGAQWSHIHNQNKNGTIHVVPLLQKQWSITAGNVSWHNVIQPIKEQFVRLSLITWLSNTDTLGISGHPPTQSAVLWQPETSNSLTHYGCSHFRRWIFSNLETRFVFAALI